MDQIAQHDNRLASNKKASASKNKKRKADEREYETKGSKKATRENKIEIQHETKNSLLAKATWVVKHWDITGTC